MSRFIQLHLLTSYPPANLNRDDNGSPKTARMGGYDRLRVSSQCLKRTWRTSDIFEKAIAKGIRTKMIGVDAFEKLSAFPVLGRSERVEIAKNIAKVFGKLKSNKLELETLVFISDTERENIERIINSFSNGLGGATEESNSLGVEIFKEISGDIKMSIEKLIDIVKCDNETALLVADWSKPQKGLKRVIKEYQNKNDKQSYDFMDKMVGNSSEWLESVRGKVAVRDEQLEMFFAAEHTKLTKDILKKLSLGALMSVKQAKNVAYGEVKHKTDIPLCQGWQEQIIAWVKDVQQSEDDDLISVENIDKLRQIISPVAIAKSSILTNEHTNADIALFGRMLASSVEYKVEAACQVAHAISVHSVVIEDDYFTAIEELNEYRDDAGASHIGETRFAAGLFYSYICINRELLVENLGGDTALATKAIQALIEAAVKVAPEGKQNSFASRAYASYVLAETGDQQPRSLSVAFLKPINQRENDDFIKDSIASLIKQKGSFDQVYGKCADDRYELNVPEEQGTLQELLDFVGGQ